MQNWEIRQLMHFQRGLDIQPFFAPDLARKQFREVAVSFKQVVAVWIAKYLEGVVSGCVAILLWERQSNENDIRKGLQMCAVWEARDKTYAVLNAFIFCPWDKEQILFARSWNNFASLKVISAENRCSNLISVFHMGTSNLMRSNLTHTPIQKLCNILFD